MAVIQPPPARTNQLDSPQWKDWLYSIYGLVSSAGGTLGTMASQNANSVAITGGSIGGVGITGSTINSTPIGVTSPNRVNTNALRTTALTGYLYGNSSSDVTASTTIPNTNITGLGTMSTQNASSVAITGGTIDGTTIGVTTPSSGYFTTTLQRNGYTVKPNAYIEAYDLSVSITVNSTATLLTPASTGSSSGITYNSGTGVFTFSQEGNYTLALAVNAIASASNQFVYIYAENNTGSGWTLNANSGKIYQLPNGQQVQIVYSNAVHRTAGQQVRYYIYSNSNKVTLQTASLPSTSTVYVPAIRIQYS